MFTFHCSCKGVMFACDARSARAQRAQRGGSAPACEVDVVNLRVCDFFGDNVVAHKTFYFGS